MNTYREGANQKGTLPKSVTRTLRLDQELDKAIGRRASNEKVSINFLVTRCLRKFTEWDIPALELGFVSIPRQVLDRFAAGKDEQTFEELGREVARDFLRQGAVYIRKEFTMESSIEMLRRSSMYGGRFSFDFEEAGDSRKHVLLIRHDQGRLWSRYYGGVLDETFRVLLGKDLSLAYTDSLCIAQMNAN